LHIIGIPFAAIVISFQSGAEYFVPVGVGVQFSLIVIHIPNQFEKIISVFCFKNQIII